MTMTSEDENRSMLELEHRTVVMLHCLLGNFLLRGMSCNGSRRIFVVCYLDRAETGRLLLST